MAPARAARSPKSIVAGILFVWLAAPAAAVPFDVDAPGLGVFGQIDVTAIAGDGIVGSFNVTLKNPDGSTMTIDQLEKSLVEDHLNRFQKVTNHQNPNADFPEKLIDPQSGGQGVLWADHRPWYLNEVPIPNPLPSPRTEADPKFQLNNNIQNLGKTLHYEDNPNAKADFSTFLVSDYDNPVWGADGPRTYSVLGGFTWNTQSGIATDPVAAVPGAFTQDFRDEIKDQFGWREASAPDTSTNTADSPRWRLRETGTDNALIIVQPTSGGSKINNLNGSRVQYAHNVFLNSAVFDIPGIIDGKKVTDATQWTKNRADPGVLDFAAFDLNLDMSDSFSGWLLAAGYISHELFMPDFSPDVSPSR